MNNIPRHVKNTWANISVSTWNVWSIAMSSFYVLSVAGLVRQQQNWLESLKCYMTLYKVNWLFPLLPNCGVSDGPRTHLTFTGALAPPHKPACNWQTIDNPCKHSHLELISVPMGVIMKYGKVIHPLYFKFPGQRQNFKKFFLCQHWY